MRLIFFCSVSCCSVDCAKVIINHRSQIFVDLLAKITIKYVKTSSFFILSRPIYFVEAVFNLKKLLKICTKTWDTKFKFFVRLLSMIHEWIFLFEFVDVSVGWLDAFLIIFTFFLFKKNGFPKMSIF